MNKPNSNPSLQAGLATPPETFVNLNLPNATDGSGSSVESVVTEDSTIQSSSDDTTTKTGSHPAENMPPTSPTNRTSPRKFYVVTRGKRTGVFDNW